MCAFGGGWGGPPPGRGGVRRDPGWGVGRRVCLWRVAEVENGIGGHRGGEFRVAGWVKVAEEAPPWMHKTSGGVDREFATWRTRFERGASSGAKGEHGSRQGGWGNPKLPLPASPAHPAGT